MKQAIKRFFLKMFLAVFVLCILCVFVVYSISSTVKTRSEGYLDYIVTGEVKINPVSISELRKLDADCILVLGAGIKDSETPSDKIGRAHV